MTRATLSAVALFALVASLAGPTAYANGVILSGTVTSAAGEKMGGVTVSAKAEGSTITTSVFTDEGGAYFFPPLPAGKYRVWAQALSFETAKGAIELGAVKRQDFTLKPAKDYFQQLPGDVMLAALPGDTPEDFRMKTQVRKNCTGCHTASYPLQHKFDEVGWNAILELMKRLNVFGHYLGAEHKGTPNIDFHQKELAAYLARARGPGESSMKVKLPERPKGETARVVFKEYDFPKEPGNGPPQPSNDGSDWLLGTPSDLNGMVGVHDVQADLDGNLWIAYSLPSRDTTVAKIDAKTGAVKKFGVPDIKGFAAGSHGIVRDEHGHLWFNTRSTVQRGHGGLAKIDPKTEKISVFYPPKPMSGTAGTLDVDLKGNVWVTSPDGALRFDIAKETFTEFKSVSYKTPHGIGTVYGLAVDRTGNGWWAIMSQDLMDYSDITTGKTGELEDAARAGGDGVADPRAAQVLRDLRGAGLQHAVRLGAGPAAARRRQERRLCLGRQFVRRQRSRASTSGPKRSSSCRCRTRRRTSPIRSRSIPSTTSGPTSGAPTRWRATTRRPGNGRYSTCQTAAPRRATSRSPNATASSR